MTFTPIQQVSLHGKRAGITTTGALFMRDNNSTMYRAVAASSADVVVDSTVLQFKTPSASTEGNVVVQSTANVVRDSTAMMFAQAGVTRRTYDMSASSTVAAYGFITMTSASATALSIELSPPIAGLYCELDIDCSASEISLGASSSLVHFASTVAVGAADRTTAFLTSTLAEALAGTVVTLRGVSTVQWKVVNCWQQGHSTGGAVELITIG